MLTEVLINLIRTRKELFAGIFQDALEEVSLANAIAEGRKNDFVSEETSLTSQIGKSLVYVLRLTIQNKILLKIFSYKLSASFGSFIIFLLFQNFVTYGFFSHPI